MSEDASPLVCPLPNDEPTRSTTSSQMSSSSTTIDTAKLITEADAVIKTDPRKAEGLYKQVLAAPKRQSLLSVGNWTRTDSISYAIVASEEALRDQEAALVKLGYLYRDEKCASIPQCTRLKGRD